MAIDFTLSPEVEAISDRVRHFIDDVVIPEEKRIAVEELETTDRGPTSKL